METKNKIGFERDETKNLKYEILNGFYVFTVFLENGDFFKIQLGAKEAVKSMFFISELEGMNETQISRHLIKTDFREDVFELFINQKTIVEPEKIGLIKNLTPLELIGIQNELLDVCICLTKMLESVKKKD